MAKTIYDRSNGLTVPQWLQYSVILLLILGIFFRFYNLDYKVYWVDETHTSLRVSGYKKGELAERVRSLRIRYLFPFFIGLEIALAYLLTSRGIELRKWSTIGWQVIAVSLIVGGTITCAVSSQAELWWNKDTARSSYYLEVARLINQAPKPLVVTDGTVIDTVSFSYELKPEVKL